MPIQFRFHPEKAVEAAALFLKLHGQPMASLGLLKMLYVADRTALKQMDQPITGDRYIATDQGLILGNIYDLLKGKPVDTENQLIQLCPFGLNLLPLLAKIVFVY
jgi:Protein of unknown function (DUF4065)